MKTILATLIICTLMAVATMRASAHLTAPLPSSPRTPISSVDQKDTTPIEKEMEAITLAIAGKPTVVICVTTERWKEIRPREDTDGMVPMVRDGFGWKTGNVIYFSPVMCNVISEYLLQHGPNPIVSFRYDSATYDWAILTLAHEAIHVWGEVNEAKTNCWALQRENYTAERLGATPAEAASITKDTASSYYPWLEKNQPDYWSAECRAGGKMDMTPSDGMFP
jgi:hypothetical protein